MNNLGNVLGRQRKYEEAEQIHQQTLKFREEVLGSEHPSTISSMINLANMLHGQGKYKETEQIYRQILVLKGKGLDQ